MNYVILTGGIPPEKHILAKHLSRAAALIGVDGAADVLYSYDVVPDVLIGDFDTADPSHVFALKARGTKIVRLETAKDETDTEAALHYAIDHGADDITILGAIGTRFDHTLANVFLLIAAHKAGVSCRIIDAHNELFVSDRDISVSGHIGQTISLLPLTDKVCVSATDLKYPLENLKLKPSITRGISNVMQQETTQLNISGGYILIVKTESNA